MEGEWEKFTLGHLLGFGGNTMGSFGCAWLRFWLTGPRYTLSFPFSDSFSYGTVRNPNFHLSVSTPAFSAFRGVTKQK
jgi:hypothetical protein